MISSIALQQKFLKKGHYDKLPKTKEELYKLYTDTYGPIDLESWTNDKLIKNIKEKKFTGKLPSTKKELQNLYLQLYKQTNTNTEIKQPEQVDIKMTIAQLKEQALKLGYTGPNLQLKKNWIALLTKLQNKDKQPLENKDTNMTISQLKIQVLKLGYTGPNLKLKKDWIALLTKLQKQPIKDKQPSDIKPIVQLEINMTIPQLKTQVLKLGYKGVYPKLKKDWIELLTKLKKPDENACKQIGGFSYTITPLGYTKNDIKIKLSNKNVGIVFTKCKNKICTFEIDDDASQYKMFTFVMENDNGTYDGMEIENNQVLTIQELPKNLHEKLLGQCKPIQVPKPALDIIDKFNKKTTDFCNNILENYKLIPIAGNGNCFFQSIANATNSTVQQVRQKMANQLTQKLVDIRNEFNTLVKTLQDYKTELLTDGTYVGDYDVEQLFPLAYSKLGLIILNTGGDANQCTITCSSNLLENKEKYIVLLFQRNLKQDTDAGAHYDLISINSKLQLSFNDLPTNLINSIHKQCKTIQLKSITEKVIEKPKLPVEQISKPNLVLPVEKEKIISKSNLVVPVEKEKIISKPNLVLPVEKIISKPNLVLPVEKKKPNIEDELNTLVHLNSDKIKQLLKDKGYTGIPPKYKKDLIELYKQLYLTKDATADIKKDEPKVENMTLVQLQTELKKKNITKYLPRTKLEMIKLLKADRCDPINNVWCKDDQVCDLRNNVCLDKPDIKSTKNVTVIFDEINGHPIAGPSVNIFKTKNDVTKQKDVEPVSITIPKSIEGDDVIHVQNINELATILESLTSQNNFNKTISLLI